MYLTERCLEGGGGPSGSFSKANVGHGAACFLYAPATGSLPRETGSHTATESGDLPAPLPTLSLGELERKDEL